jgi:hypothetical protein
MTASGAVMNNSSLDAVKAGLNVTESSASLANAGSVIAIVPF